MNKITFYLISFIILLFPILFTFWVGNSLFGNHPSQGGITNLINLEYIILLLILSNFIAVFILSKKSVKQGLLWGIFGSIISYLLWNSDAIFSEYILLVLFGVLYFLVLFILILWLYSYISSKFWQYLKQNLGNFA